MTIERRDIGKDDDRQSAEEPALERDEVGYRRPPKEHTIKKGEVRNPWGRPGKPKPKADFLDGYVVVTVNGRKQKITRDQAVDEILFREVMRGSVPAAKHLDRRAEKRRAVNAQGTNDEVLSEEDEQILERFLEKETERRLKEGDRK